MRNLEQINKDLAKATTAADKLLLLNEKSMLEQKMHTKEINKKMYSTEKKFNEYSLKELDEIYKNDREFYDALVKESNKPFEERQKKVDAKKLSTFAKELKEREGIIWATKTN